jgi:hypothetical protein
MTDFNISLGIDHGITNGLPTSGDNDIGTIRYGGNVADSTFFNATALGGPNRVTTLVSGVDGLSGILSAGPFNGGDQVIRRVTTDIANVANNVLLAGASNSANGQSIHTVFKNAVVYYKRGIRENHWNHFSGVWEAGFPETANSGIWDQATDADQGDDARTNTTDDAAHPTAAIPGEFVYRDGSPTPVQDDYAAKTLF